MFEITDELIKQWFQYKIFVMLMQNQWLEKAEEYRNIFYPALQIEQKTLDENVKNIETQENPIELTIKQIQDKLTEMWISFNKNMTKTTLLWLLNNN